MSDRVAARALLLRLRARELGTVTADDRVSEPLAAQLVGMSPSTLKALRLEGSGPHFFRLGAGPGDRLSYDLLDLAAWLEGLRACPGCRATALDR